MTESVNPRYPGAEDTSGGHDPAAGPLSLSPTQILGIVIRVLAAALTLAAAIKVGITVHEDIFGFTVRLPSDAAQVSACICFILTNGFTFAYALWSTPISVERSDVLGVSQMLSIGDLMMVVLLFSYNGTMVLATGVISEKGCDKYDNTYDSFCGHVKVSVLMSFIAAVAYLMLFTLSIINLHKRPRFI